MKKNKFVTRRRAWYGRPAWWVCGAALLVCLAFAARAGSATQSAAPAPTAPVPTAQQPAPAGAPQTAAAPSSSTPSGSAPVRPTPAPDPRSPRNPDAAQTGTRPGPDAPAKSFPEEEDEGDEPSTFGKGAAEAAVQGALERSQGNPGAAPGKTAVVDSVPATTTNAVVQQGNRLQGLSLWRKAKLSGTGDAAAYVAQTTEGKRVKLTVDPVLQRKMNALLASYRPQTAAIVALDPRTGKILALSEYSTEGSAEGSATRAAYPAASVFKIITGAALLEKGIAPSTETCFHGGMHGIVGDLLLDKPRLDRRCLSLSMALAKSANVVFAKMAMKHLDGDTLRKEAESFLFNRPLLNQPVDPSTASIPASGLEFAKSAAGFGQVKLSPLHAALIAGAVANGGVANEPTLIEEVEGAEVPSLATRRLLKKETADTLRDMMKLTVSEGTAASSFREHGRKVLGNIVVGGKTGSLSTHSGPFKDYSWFVGFAPADAPTIAVAVVVVNGLKWRIHAPFVAREALRAYLVGGAVGQPPVARVHRHHRRRRHR